MKITLYAPKTPTRAHKVLFDRDLPFRPKSERRKDVYRRKPKNYRDRDEQYNC